MRLHAAFRRTALCFTSMKVMHGKQRRMCGAGARLLTPHSMHLRPPDQGSRDAWAALAAARFGQPPLAVQCSGTNALCAVPYADFEGLPCHPQRRAYALALRSLLAAQLARTPAVGCTMQGYRLAREAMQQLQPATCACSARVGSSKSLEPPSSGTAAGTASGRQRRLSLDWPVKRPASEAFAAASSDTGGRLDLLLVLGRGSFGCVYLGNFRSRRDDPKVQVAVKVRARWVNSLD